VAAVALAAAAGPARAAEPPSCTLTPLEEQYADADAAFVGRVVAERAGSGGRRTYRFTVDRVLKGPIGKEVDVSAPSLTDRDGTPLAHGVTVGVLAQLEGANVTTTSCGLIEAGSLVTASEPERGQGIKIVIGIVIAALALGFALLRLRRRRGAGEPPAAAPRSGRSGP
jgi:hypothetical protein